MILFYKKIQQLPAEQRYLFLCYRVNLHSIKEFIETNYNFAKLGSVTIQATSQWEKLRLFICVFADVGVGLDDAVLIKKIIFVKVLYLYFLNAHYNGRKLTVINTNF